MPRTPYISGPPSYGQTKKTSLNKNLNFNTLSIEMNESPDSTSPVEIEPMFHYEEEDQSMQHSIEDICSAKPPPVPKFYNPESKPFEHELLNQKY